jgi:exosortase
MNTAAPQLPEEAAIPDARVSPASKSAVTGSTCLLFAFGFAPLLVLFFVNLWDRPHYQFFPLALMGAMFLARSRFKDVAAPLQPGRPIITALLLAASFLLLATGTLFWSPWLGGIAALIGVAGLVWWAGGYPFLRAMLPAMLILLVIIPPPLAADSRLVQHLRVLAVSSSSRVLDLLNITHSLSGNVIELPGQNLLVDEACSGINSVLITLACCLFYGLWRRRSAFHIVFFLVSSLSFVLLGNMMRITLGAWLKFRFGFDILSARSHELSGLLLFLAYLILILSVDQLVVFVAKPAHPRRHRSRHSMAAAPLERNPLPVRTASLPGLAVGCAFAFLGCVQLGLGWVHYQASKARLPQAQPALREGATFAMPEQIGDWKRLNTEVPPLQKVETMGVFSQIWHYRRGETLASVALDYPFQGYHDVTLCYTLRGWDLLKQTARLPKAANAGPPFAEVQMLNHMGLHGALWFSAVDEQGLWVAGADPNPGLGRSVLARFRKQSARPPVTYQMQVLVTGFNPLSLSDRQESEHFFQQARGLLWRQLFAQMRRKP